MKDISHARTANTATTSMLGSPLTMPVRRTLRQPWTMRKTLLLALIIIVIIVPTSAALAQVLTPAEIKDPDLRLLQQQYINDLKVVGQDIQALPLKYRFYLNRNLDLDESQQPHADQRSIRFDRYNGQTVLAVTGNYYAAYPEKIGADQRARTTFLNVVMPILKSEVPRFQSNHEVQGYALEISHHVLGKVMGVIVERPENLMVFLPQSGALQLLGSRDENVQQAGLMQGQIFLNAQPINIWLNGEGPQPAPGTGPSLSSTERPEPPTGTQVPQTGEGTVGPAVSTAVPPVVKPNDVVVTPVRDASPQALAALQDSSQEVLARLVKELDPQAHFVGYASQSFVAFRQGIYLELSVNTTLPESAAGSRYKLAAMAFDDHVAHLLRPTLAYFKEESKFDGISFSTTVHLAGRSPAALKTEAVEFFFPFSALRCYEKYDCTGQQIVDTGAVLINGERVALDLQVAEGGPGR
jgi:hypothetical protein